MFEDYKSSKWIQEPELVENLEKTEKRALEPFGLLAAQQKEGKAGRNSLEDKTLQIHRR